MKQEYWYVIHYDFIRQGKFGNYEQLKSKYRKPIIEELKKLGFIEKKKDKYTVFITENESQWKQLVNESYRKIMNMFPEEEHVKDNIIVYKMRKFEQDIIDKLYRKYGEVWFGVITGKSYRSYGRTLNDSGLRADIFKDKGFLDEKIILEAFAEVL